MLNIHILFGALGLLSGSINLMLKKGGCIPMDFTGKTMKNFVFIDPIGYDLEEDLLFWIQLCLDFNPLAKASKKRKL